MEKPEAKYGAGGGSLTETLRLLQIVSVLVSVLCSSPGHDGATMPRRRIVLAPPRGLQLRAVGVGARAACPAAVDAGDWLKAGWVVGMQAVVVSC